MNALGKYRKARKNGPHFTYAKQTIRCIDRDIGKIRNARKRRACAVALLEYLEEWPKRPGAFGTISHDRDIQARFEAVCTSIYEAYAYAPSGFNAREYTLYVMGHLQRVAGSCFLEAE